MRLALWAQLCRGFGRICLIYDRDQSVVVNGLKFEPFRLLYGVPQGSVLGPIPFVLYTKPLDDIFDRHSVCHHSFADDTQMRNSSSLD